jgi:hypothetical protein
LLNQEVGFLRVGYPILEQPQVVVSDSAVHLPQKMKAYCCSPSR